MRPIIKQAMKPSIRLAILPVLLAIVATHSTSSAEEPRSVPIVIAHRGASGYLPEHTLPGAAMAHALGADYIEQDIVLTKDGRPLVIHDLFLDYVTNVAEVIPDRHREDGHYYVVDFTLEEVKSLRAHERTHPTTGKPLYPKRFPLGQGSFSLASLGEHIELIQGLNRATGRSVGVCVEIKDPAWHRKHGFDISRVVHQTLTDYGYKTRRDTAIIQCFDFAEAARLRKEFKTDLRIVQLLNEKVWRLPRDATPEEISGQLLAIAQYADAIGPGVDFLLAVTRDESSPKLAELLDLAHQSKLQVYCYTLRADVLPSGYTSFGELAQTFTTAGSDGFFTDHADKLLSIAASVK